MFDPKRPTAKHASYQRLCDLSMLPGDLLGGLPALLARKDVYFPREVPDGSGAVVVGGLRVDPYANRLSRLTLFNRFRDGVDDLVGRVFSRRVKWDEQTPRSIAGDRKSGAFGFVDDVDGGGTNAHVFLRRRCRSSAAKGCDFVLVDFPKTENAGLRSVAEERRAGLRPFWVPYAREAVADWSHAIVAGRKTLTYLKLADAWSHPETKVSHPALRLFFADGTSPVRFEVWAALDPKKVGLDPLSIEDGKAWQRVEEGFRQPHVEIPFGAYSTDADVPFEAEPPLIDAAYLNLSHCRKTGSIDNAQHAVGFPRMYASGITYQDFKDQMKGAHAADRFLVIPDAGGSVAFAEPQGSSWGAVEATIQNIEKRMDTLLSKPLEKSSAQPLTAQGEANSEAARMSRLESWVQQWTDSTNLLLYFTAIDLGEVKPGADGGWGAVEFNAKWTASSRDVEVVRVAADLSDRGLISRETEFRIAQEFGVVPEEADFEEEQQRIEEEGPKPGMPKEDSPDPFAEPSDDPARALLDAALGGKVA